MELAASAVATCTGRTDLTTIATESYLNLKRGDMWSRMQPEKSAMGRRASQPQTQSRTTVDGKGRHRACQRNTKLPIFGPL